MSFGAFNANPQQTGTTGGGLFGSTFGSTQNTSTPVAGSTLFGNPNAAQQGTNTGAGLFGVPNTSQSATGTTGGGLFGSTQPAGGLFGNTNANATQQQPAGGLFGTAGQQGTTVTAPTGGLFGSTAQTGTAGSNLFGNTNANPTAGTSTTTGGGLFGNTAATNPAGGLFGNTAANPQAAPSGGLFGSTTAAPNTTGGGLFGNTANTSTTGTGGLFGSTTAAPSTTGGGLFGSTTTAPATTGGGLFGAQPQQTSLFASGAPSAGNSFFGAAQPQQQQQTSLFGQQKPAGGLFGGSMLGGNSLLGSTTSNLFSSKAAAGPNPQQDAQMQFMQLAQRMQGIQAAWDPSSPQCRFQHYFYNLVDPSQVHLYGRPSNATNDTLWQRAVNENPDPSCHVPVIASGFEDLQKRVEAQTQQATEQQQKIKDLQTRISNLVQRHQLSNASRLQRAATLQTQLTHRVLRLVQHLHLLIPALRSSALRPEEEALRTALEEIDEEVRRPGGTGRMRGKLNELWALVGAVSAARERDRRSSGPGVEWTVVDEDGLAQIAQILGEGQTGLAHLTKLLQNDLKDLAVILGKDPKEYDSNLGSSTATLRASTL